MQTKNSEMNNFLLELKDFEERHTARKYLYFIIENYEKILEEKEKKGNGEYKEHKNLFVTFKKIKANDDEISQPFTIVKRGPYLSETFRILKYKGKKLIPNKEDITFGEWFKRHVISEKGEIEKLEVAEGGYSLQKIFEGRFKVKWNSCFKISVERILSRSLDYYKNLKILW